MKLKIDSSAICSWFRSDRNCPSCDLCGQSVGGELSLAFVRADGQPRQPDDPCPNPLYPTQGDTHTIAWVHDRCRTTWELTKGGVPLQLTFPLQEEHP